MRSNQNSIPKNISTDMALASKAIGDIMKRIEFTHSDDYNDLFAELYDCMENYSFSPENTIYFTDIPIHISMFKNTKYMEYICVIYISEDYGCGHITMQLDPNMMKIMSVMEFNALCVKTVFDRNPRLKKYRFS